MENLPLSLSLYIIRSSAATRSRDPRLVKYDDANMRLLPQLSTRSAAKMVFRYFLFEKYK